LCGKKLASAKEQRGANGTFSILKPAYTSTTVTNQIGEVEGGRRSLSNEEGRRKKTDSEVVVRKARGEPGNR